MSAVRPTWKTIGVLTIFATLFLAIPLAAASSPPPPPPIPPGSQSATWAYGALITWNDSDINHWSGNNSSYSSSFSEKGQIALGLEVIYIQTNTSGGEMIQTYTALTLTAQVSMSSQASSGSVSESGSANFNAAVWYVIQNYVNLTNSATVTNATGASATAIGILNAQSNVAANATASFSASASESSGGTSSSFSANGNFAAAVQANAGVSFTPALGFIPLNVAPGNSWTSQSNYSASGSFAAATHEYVSFPEAVAGSVGNKSGQCPTGSTLQGSNCVINNSTSASFSLSTTGVLYLFGQDLGVVTLPTTVNGQTIQAQEIDISTQGPFGFTDGCVLVPSQLASVGGSGTPLAPAHPLSRVLTTSPGGDNMYFSASNPSHVGFSGNNQGNVGGKTFNTQAQTPQVAEQQAQNNLASTQPGKQSAGLPIMLILVVVVVAVVAALGVLVWSGRRKRKTASTMAPQMQATPNYGGGPQQPGYAPTGPQPQSPAYPPGYPPQ